MTYLQSLRKLEIVMNYLKNREMREWGSEYSSAIWQGVYDVDRIYRDLKYGKKCAVCQVLSDTPLCESCKAYYRRDGKFHGEY
jgi:hypothetical protein